MDGFSAARLWLILPSHTDGLSCPWLIDIDRAEARRKDVEALKRMEVPGQNKAKQGKLRQNKAKQGEIN